MRYLVQWEIEIDADSPINAIHQACAMMPAPENDEDTTATYFTVEDLDAQRTMHFDIDGDEWAQVDE